MNILILSAGTRDKVVQYFKREIADQGRIIATDCSNLAPAVYDADAFYLVPRITVPGYIDRILEICRKEKITGVFSLIDPELSMLAKEREKFLEIGTTPIISDYDLVETCFCLFENDLNVSKTAVRLYMHRNTLIYRIAKLKRLTGLDVCRFDDAVSFIILYRCYFEEARKNGTK